jgi:uncharacterized protein (TIGR02145 family)
MKKLFILLSISIALVSNTFAQSEFVPRVTEKGHSINQYDADGKKHGYWEAYINEHMKLVKKKEQAAFIVMVYYHHNENLFEGYFYDHYKKNKVINSLPKYEFGDPKLLNGKFSFESKSTSQNLKYEFCNGYIELIETGFLGYMNKKDWNYEQDKHYLNFTYNFKKEINGIQGSYQVIEYKDDQIKMASWVRSFNDRWYNSSDCGLCSAFTDSSITLNNQTWSSANLKVSKFRNGDDIFYAESLEDFERCEEEDIPACSNFKGQLVYNWHAINDPRGLAPKGWRLANDEDFKELIEKLGVNHVYFLRSSYSRDTNAKLGANCSGFDASKKGYEAPWWSVNNENSETAHAWVIDDQTLTYILEPLDTFYAVRMIKE